jgi:Inward rectifier potassium channel C-terminal domain
VICACPAQRPSAGDHQQFPERQLGLACSGFEEPEISI